MEDKKCERCGRIELTEKEKCNCGGEMKPFNWYLPEKEKVPAEQGRS
jgi:RNA polymerase subunit RPABC4/transcription elongation factor Spt4